MQFKLYSVIQKSKTRQNNNNNNRKSCFIITMNYVKNISKNTY